MALAPTKATLQQPQGDGAEAAAQAGSTHHWPLAPKKTPFQGIDPHLTRCQGGEHTTRESFPAPALWQGGWEEAEQQPLCYTKFPMEMVLVPAHCMPFGMLEPPDNCKQGQKPPWILSSCRFDANKQLSAHKSQCQ